MIQKCRDFILVRVAMSIPKFDHFVDDGELCYTYGHVTWRDSQILQNLKQENRPGIKTRESTRSAEEYSLFVFNRYM